MTLNSIWQRVATQSVSLPDGFSCSFYIDARLSSQSKENNRSYIDVRMGSILGPGASAQLDTYTFTCTYCPTVQNGSRWFLANEVITSKTGQEIPHNSAGDASVTLRATVYTQVGINADFSAVVDLPKIPRESYITATDAYIESYSAIKIYRYSNTYTTTLRYQFYSLSGTIVSKTSSENVQFNIPASFYTQIPNSSMVRCTIYCDTYSGNTKIGDSMPFEIWVIADPNKCYPLLATTGVYDSNPKTIALTGDNHVTIKGYSDAKIPYTITPRNSATITTRTVNGRELGSNSGEVTFYGTTFRDYTFYVADSRKYDRTFTISNSLIDYLPLSITPNFYRPEPTTGEVSLEFKGSYWNDDFGAEQNALEIKWEYKEANETEWKTGGTISSTQYTIVDNTVTSKNAIALTNPTPDGVNPNFDYQKQYDFRLLFKDKLVDTYRTNRVPEGVPIFWWDKESFGVEVPLYLRSGNEVLDYSKVDSNALTLHDKNGSNIYPCPYFPIGYIYISAVNINPATYFGGRWEQIKDVFLLACGNVYSNGSTGGEASVALKVNEMPSHNHTQEAHSHAQHNDTWMNTTPYDGLIPTGGTFAASAGRATYYTGTAMPAIGYTGGGQAHNNMPPYLAVYMFRRVA